MAEEEGDQAHDPAHREEGEAGAFVAGRAGLPGAVEGGTAVCLAEAVPTVGGPP